MIFSPSALVINKPSANSIIPLFIPCSSSPAPGRINKRKKSTNAFTWVSDCPTPTVSTNIISNPAFSQSKIVSYDWLATPPSSPFEGVGLMYTLGRLLSCSILVLSPRILPPVNEELGSIAKTATL